jgi:NADPH-dependent curcumin reductase CurA
MTTQNRQVLLASRPRDAVIEDNFRLVDAPIPKPGPDEVLVQNQWLSLDPYMRGRMNDVKSYVPPAKLDEVMVGQTVGVVVESHDASFRAGDRVLTQLGWQLYGIAKGKDLTAIDASAIPASYYLGIVGMPGMTAWFGLNEIGQPKAGDTLVVSAASGAVGSVVGQLAKILGCRVVGIAGGKTKCDYVAGELGFDACVDYKAGRLFDDLRAACPDGIDVCFENVGGAILDTSLRLANRYARFVICGLIAEYNAAQPYGYTRLRSVLVNRIKMQGMIVFDWHARYDEARAALAHHVVAGQLKYRESVIEGLENAPRGFIGLLRGENFGKQLVKLA